MPARAEAASANRIKRVAFQLFDASDALAKFLAGALDYAIAFHNARDNAAARAALSTDGWMPPFLTGNDLVVRDQQRDERVLFLSASGAGNSGGHGGSDLEEIAAIHGLKSPARSRRAPMSDPD